MSIKTWVTAHLKQGDIRALAAIKRGQPVNEEIRVDRLVARGFVSRSRNGTPRITCLGRVALIGRKVTKS